MTLSPPLTVPELHVSCCMLMLRTLCYSYVEVYLMLNSTSALPVGYWLL